MSAPRKKLSIGWIQSGDCDWPPRVKSLSVDIIRLKADLLASQVEMTNINMMEANKIKLLNDVSELHRRLSNAYRNLANELVVAQVTLAHSTLITRSNKDDEEVEL